MAVPYLGTIMLDDSNMLLQENNFLIGDSSSSTISRANTPDVLTRATSRNSLHVSKIIIIGVVFFAILTWFEFIRTLYDAVFTIGSDDHHPVILTKSLIYAIFITAIAIIIVYIIEYNIIYYR